MRATRLLLDHVLAAVLVAALIGLLVPSAARLDVLVVPALAVMIGAVGLTIPLGEIRRIRPDRFGLLILAQLPMPVVAFGVAVLLDLPDPLVLGFVLLAAVPTEFTAPVFARLAHADVRLVLAALVAMGFASVALVPLFLRLLTGATTTFDPTAILTPLLLAVVVPLGLAMLVRARWPEPVARRHEGWLAASALMLLFVMLVVTASNAPLLLHRPINLVPVIVGAFVLNAAGYAIGWLAGPRRDYEARAAFLFTTGMRDFALAAGLVLAAGFTPAAALPAAVFGIVETLTAATLAKRLASIR